MQGKKRKIPKVRKVQRRIVKRKKGTILSEANYILSRAQNFDSRVVSFGPLLFFSTKNGDAWMLDPGDGLALCLAREGEPQSVHIITHGKEQSEVAIMHEDRSKAEETRCNKRCLKTKVIGGDIY
jgi:hypothetical protein